MTDFDMICICGPDGLREAEEMRLDVQRRLGCRAEDLATAVVLSLAWTFGADVEVLSDQWFGVEFAASDLGALIPCDLPLDGLCRAWQALAEAHPEKIAGWGRENADDCCISHDQLNAVGVAGEASDAHFKTCSACVTKDGWRPCPDGKALFDARIATKRAVNNKWGLPPFETAPRFWGEAGR